MSAKQLPVRTKIALLFLLRSFAGLLNTFWSVCPSVEPEEGDAVPKARKPRKSKAGAAEADVDDTDPHSDPTAKPRKASKAPKVWEPKYKTGVDFFCSLPRDARVTPPRAANFALLITLHVLKLRGRDTVTKDELVDAAEASQLSEKGIKPRGAATSVNAGKVFQYDGWSGFRKYLAQAPAGHDAPMCSTWGKNPVHIRLTDEGAALAARLHAAAEARGDCSCGLIRHAGTGGGGGAAAGRGGGAAAAAAGGGDGGSGAAAAGGRGAAPPQRREPAPPRSAVPPTAYGGGGGGGDDDDCVIIDDDDDGGGDAHPPPAKRPRQASAPVPAPAPPPPPPPAGGAAAGAAGGFEWRPPPAWRLSGVGAEDAEGGGLRSPPLRPGQSFSDAYTIVLLIDNREQYAHAASDGGRAGALEAGLARLRERGIPAEPRALPIGDALWVARSKASPVSEFCLDCVVERKRVDDLESSIRDGRYKKQKYFLKRCGLRRPAYLLEGVPGGGGPATAWKVKAVKTALLTTEVSDGFAVLRTPNNHGTFDLYGRLTGALGALFRDAVGAPQHASSRALAPALVAAAASPTSPSYDDFVACVEAAKREHTSVRALWGRMLTAVPGVGGEVAQAVTWEYPTPGALRGCFAAATARGGREGARAALAHIKTSAHKTIGAVVAGRIHDWFHHGA